ncbi:MAG: 6-bladed beta-propeller [Gemmatimonadetes bacterium]|nr:6-bladed beta-propeller [Gemmatimonadota bacterium]
MEEKPAVVIGTLDGPPETLFELIDEVRLLDDGRIVVADRGQNLIRVFARDGTFLVERGGEGDGPGEFAAVGNLHVVPPDTLVVWDHRLRRITRFRADGALLSTTPFTVQGSDAETLVGRLGDGGYVTMGFLPGGVFDPANRSISPDSMALDLYAPDGAYAHEIARASGMIRDLHPLPLTPFLHARIVGDRILYTDGMAPEIVVVDGQGAPAESFALNIPEIDPREGRARFDEALAASDVELSPMLAEWLPTVASGHPIPRIAELLVDDQRRIWVKPYDPGTDSWIFRFLGRQVGVAAGGAWAVLDAGGTEIAEASLPGSLMPTDVHGDRVAGVTVDDIGVHRAVVYQLAR